jgi:hypothetical protein
MNAHLPYPLSFASAAYDPIDQKTYIFGGMDNNRLNHGEILRYDPVADEIAVMAGRLPTPRSATSAVYASGNGLIYVSGGVGADRPPTELVGGPCPVGWLGEALCYSDILAYAPGLDTVAPGYTLPSGRFGTFAVSTGCRIFVLGGYDGQLLDDIIYRTTCTVL